HVFPGELPGMSSDDVRGMLIEGTGSRKYGLLKRDQESPDAVRPDNAAVAAVIERAAGLPLYVHFVVEDILKGSFRFGDLEHRLPPGLEAYYDDLLRRLSIGDLQ